MKEISSEERLERESPSARAEPTPTAEELVKVDCLPGEDLLRARNVGRTETDRLQDYAALYTGLMKKVKLFEEALVRNPDLQYQEGSQRLAVGQEVCVQQAGDVRVEFERFVRELVELPTEQEVKGGTTVTVARTDFDALRQAIETLGPEDKEALLFRVNAAEQRLDAGKPNTGKTKAKKRSGK